MRLVTFCRPENGRRYRVGALNSRGKILNLNPLISDGELSDAGMLECFDLDSGFLYRVRSAFANRDSLIEVDRDRVVICAPVPRPGKIICIGLNYRDHAAESGMPIPESPVIFSKFSSCAIGPNAPIVIPNRSTQTDFEAELAFVVGRRARNVKREDALNYVFGYTNFNDVSARDFQFADGQWQRGKSCETFAPLGEVIVTADEIPDPQNLTIKLRLNGEVMQDSNTSQMIFGVAELIEFLSRHITLEPGDIVATGTPPGVGFARKPPVYLKDGDVVEVEIEKLGVLSNRVVSSDYV